MVESCYGHHKGEPTTSTCVVRIAKYHPQTTTTNTVQRNLVQGTPQKLEYFTSTDILVSEEVVFVASQGST